MYVLEMKMAFWDCVCSYVLGKSDQNSIMSCSCCLHCIFLIIGTCIPLIVNNKVFILLKNECFVKLLWMHDLKTYYNSLFGLP